MGRSILRGAADRDAPAEEAAIDRANRAAGRRPVPEVYWSLMNAAERSRNYVAAIKLAVTPEKMNARARDLEIERSVQDRLLDELLRDPAYRKQVFA